MEQVKLQAELEDLQQDNETLNLALGQLQGQSDALRSRQQARPTEAAEADQRRRRGDEMRKALLTDDVGGGDEDEDVLDKVKRGSRGFLIFMTLVRRLNKGLDKHMPFTRDIRFIQARYGTSVSAYFSFYYWLIIRLAAVGLHVNHRTVSDHHLFSLTLWCLRSYCWLALVCMGAMSWHVIKLMLYRSASVSDLFSLYGILPYVMLYSSFHVDEALLYAGLTVVIAVILLWTALTKWAREDRIAKTLDASDAELKVET